MRPRKGLSLIELLVVIAIISILLSIIIPATGKVKQIALRVKCAHNLKQINLAMHLYLNNNNDIYPCAEDKSPGVWLWMGRGWRPYLDSAMGVEKQKNKSHIFLCPADRTSPDKYDSTSYAYSMTFYHSPEQIDSMSTSADTYTNPQPSVPQSSSNVKKPAQKILIGEWNSHHFRLSSNDEKGWWGWKGKRNFLFADGSIDFLDAKDIHSANDGLPDANLTIGGIEGKDRKGSRIGVRR